ncbi:hypothetical protein C8F04DRAFT_951184 [Mycena alexandri]|uniref:hAT-like transposase RNase-H fold domain-containing protein n=1 Tax=Mycena alexandri TaxID=1745969 RepID=A0AAD6T3V3_9AGAR|nr:hypothetical protein C8F04DRAFT_951184 [Mycena alexandri]
MVFMVLKYRRGYREFTNDESNGLQSYALTAAEWTVLDDLREILCSFKDATLFFSRDSATLASVIPAMDKIDALLATAILQRPSGNKTFSAPIKAALLRSKHTLNRYYALAFHSRIYRIALILHPRYKIGYLEDNDWETDDIKAAKEELTEVFGLYKDAYDAVVEVDESSDVEGMPAVRLVPVERQFSGV